MHCPGDVPAQVLLGGQDQTRDGRWERRARVELVGRVLGHRAAHRSAIKLRAVAAQALTEARQDLELAFEDVYLRLHDGGAPGQCHQLGGLLGVIALGVVVGRSPEFVEGLRPLRLVVGRFGASLLREQLDFADLLGKEVDLTSGPLRDL